jgi:hypothetical protein
MQGDGNLVLYALDFPGAVWATNTTSGPIVALQMQGDGNLTIVDYTSGPGVVKWATNTAGYPGARFQLQDDGNLVLLSASGQILWALNRPHPPTACGALTAGQGLTQGKSLVSCDGRFTLTMQGDGNLVLSQAGVGPIWSTGTTSGPIVALQMQGDGNLVIVDYTSGTGVPKWSSNTGGNPGASFLVQNDGNLVVYNASQVPIWASNTCCR